MADVISPRCETANPEVIIIGNGPSGICLSYLLSGFWPFYNSSQDGVAHLDEIIQARLSNVTPELSLVEQDLEYLSDGLEGRSPNPVSLLFDALSNPGADIGARHPSLLRWEFFRHRQVPHLVLGRKKPGGIWQNHYEQMSDVRTKTLSLGSWMELPGMSLEEWLNKRNSTMRIRQENNGRLSMTDIAGYFSEYVRRQNLSQFFLDSTTVTSLNRVAAAGAGSLDCESGEVEEEFESQRGQATLWEVCGYQTTYNERGQEQRNDFRYTAPTVVLATGVYDNPLNLGVLGENLPYVVHSFQDLEKCLERRFSSFVDPVVVVGAGLTAADAILALRRRKIPTVHIYRHRAASGIYSQLAPKVYPEYHVVYRLMNSEDSPEWYTGYSEVDVLEFTAERDVLIRCKHSKCETAIRASLVAVLIGSSSDLTFICPSVLNSLSGRRNSQIDGKRNLVRISPFSHECIGHPGLYAMGPLVGDPMVRFIRGGALAITSNIWNKKLQASGNTTSAHSNTFFNSALRNDRLSTLEEKMDF